MKLCEELRNPVALKIKINHVVSTFSWITKGNPRKGYDYHKKIGGKIKWSGDIESDSFDSEVEDNLRQHIDEAIKDMKKGNVHRYEFIVTLTNQDD